MACDCIHDVNQGLAPFNAHVAVSVDQAHGEPKVIVETHQHGPLDGDVFLVANYCPFCGVKYGSAPPIGGARAGEGSDHVH